MSVLPAVIASPHCTAPDRKSCSNADGEFAKRAMGAKISGARTDDDTISPDCARGAYTKEDDDYRRAIREGKQLRKLLGRMKYGKVAMPEVSNFGDNAKKFEKLLDRGDGIW